jgi:hypothetical protein
VHIYIYVKIDASGYDIATTSLKSLVGSHRGSHYLRGCKRLKALATGGTEENRRVVLVRGLQTGRTRSNNSLEDGKATRPRSVPVNLRRVEVLYVELGALD